MSREIRNVLARLRWPEEYIETVREIFAPAEIHLADKDDTGRVRELLGFCDVALIDGVLDDNFLSAPNLKWAHCDQSGIDAYAPQRLADSDLIVTSSKGRSGPVLAEHALFFMLAFCYDVKRLLRAQSRRVWADHDQDDLRGLYGRKVCIVGYGATGSHLARQCQAFGMDITAYRRRNIPADAGGVTMFSREAGDHLEAAVRGADFTVMCAALNDDSYRMLGAREIAAMKPGSVLVNMARAQLVDEGAMITALRSGQLSGAGLDVTDPVEPLPPWHRLWGQPNLLLTPHVTPQMPDRTARTLDILRENADRYRRGEPLKFEFGEDDVFSRGERPQYFKGYHRIMALWKSIGERLA
ncbi:D-2-hydroxyacid dehydrogenase [uncultured Hyphomonas sp.]|uniref:D-2-hydroxyacid dehydrogenase n=1 Tax=uncultured Hyphomonas sp. TaxID=225298 RepID=UPI002AAC4C09|nr:D-2-hydroxyacid dehydrogenase [uncultured Hyphomonas sp.]